MADCPLADECPNFTEQIEGMGCTHLSDRGGMDWCQHYSQPIEDLKTAPVVPGQEVVVDVTDMHESGAGVGHTEDGYVVMVDGVLPEARVRVEVTTVKPNYARADLVEKIADEAGGEEEAEGDEESESGDEEESSRGPDRERLGSRENFWGS
ncbi:TRAM domain-containing protein [Halospeciosus flavus]|uniref:TRAM domain-containing protein n=1 Tax=Halospeciosus flavus TaxID=3032283 RepID=A0ABD5Z7R6_9EURY|nr:TRAM domain-containing protein [Halospeciosus flavus]